ncbi:hypothetical protein CW304_24450 [Bacillus sp. UFRGS-B20]|nr:hypothetical protein CW304_24450 [Bacillus sp. UFRGS-B20]
MLQLSSNELRATASPLPESLTSLLSKYFCDVPLLTPSTYSMNDVWKIEINSRTSFHGRALHK